MADAPPVVVGTGGSGGIGRARCQRLAARGSNVVIAYGNNEERAQAACDKLVRDCEPLFVQQAEDIDSARARFAHAFRELVQALAAGGDPIRPRKLIGLIHEVRPEFERGAQQDAHELLRTVLDALHEELKRPLSAPELDCARARRALGAKR